MSVAAAAFPNSRMTPRKTRRCTVNLHYPETWAVRPNPMAEVMESRTRAWMRGRGLLATAAEAERFDGVYAGECGNWPFPFAEPERAEVITHAMALWATGERRGWEAIDMLLGTSMSREWLTRYRTHVREWVNSLDRAPAGGPVGEYLARRRTAVGMRANLDLIEYQIGWELPAEVIADEDLRGMLDAAADCVTLLRELFGYGGGQAGLVDAVMREFGDDFGDAFKWVSHMHQRQVRELRERETRLVARYPEHPMLLAWSGALHCAIYGLAQWHSRARRNRTTHSSDGWTVQLTITPACPDPF